jgi:signal transduction histidine kinase
LNIDLKKLKEKIDFKSLKFKIWIYFAIFAVIILLLLWLLQIVFINTYYEGMKKSEVINTANKIINSFSNNSFQNTIDEYAYEKDININIYNLNGNLIYASNIDEIRPVRPLIVEFQVLLNKLGNNKGEFIYKQESTRFNIPMLIYGRMLNSKYVLLITTPLEPIDSTTHILANQLIYVTIIALLAGFIISLFISKKLSKPIVEITNTASNLANGNYNVVFEKGDYTEIDNLVTTLNYATRELSRTDQLRKELIANISHDLKTPLTMIKSYAEMSRDLSKDDKKKRTKHLNVIIEETDRLTLLINDIMKLSKLESKIDELKITKFDISKLVKDIINRFSYLVEKDKYEIEINIDNNLYVSADKEKIEQVIYNLISNAINYTGDDKKVIVNLKGLNDIVRFEVIDNGSGISKKNLEHIWDRYYKVDSEHKRSVVGTGLGLAIVKNILIMHNAKFGVDSVINKGSTFYFELKEENMK